jgi:DNA gyrase subunit B
MTQFMHTRVDRIDDGVTKTMPEDEYSSEHIQVLSGIEGVRKRPGMYFWSVDSRATERFVYELVSNAIDCYLSGTATFASIEIDDDTIIVEDDGSGLPFELPSESEGMSLATKYLTTMHCTGSSDGHAPHIHVRYPDGLGLAVLNAASSHLNIQSWRDGVCWEQEFKQGIPISEPIIINRGSNRGTRVKITPDPELFKDAKPRSNIIRKNLFEIAHLVKGIEIRFQRERFHAPIGLVQLLPFMNINLDLYDGIYNSHSQQSLPFHATVKRDRVLIDAVACDSIPSKNPRIYSWVNGAVSVEEGSHVDGFLNALKEVKWQPASILIHVVMFDPEFAGPMKTKLAVPKIAKIVKDALLEPLQQYCLDQENSM